MRRTPAGYPAITVPWLWADGVACWFFVLIRKHQTGQEIERILRHEDVHLRQQRWIFPWWLIRYWTSDHYRLAQEAPAYAENVRWFIDRFGPLVDIPTLTRHYAEMLHRDLYHIADTFTIEEIDARITALLEATDDDV